MKRNFLLFLLVLCGVTLFSASVAHAQSKSVVVERRDGDMTIHADGHVDVVETWVVHFQGGPFRFAFREIPYNRISSLQFQGVSENGTAFTRDNTQDPNTYRVEAGSGRRTIYWYFSPTTDETRTFELRYTLYDALRIYDGGDQFWWKFIEDDRGYPIQASHVTVHLPGDFPQDEILAATYENSIETDGANVVNGSTVEFNGGPFPDGVTWEIRTQFPHGVVTQSKQKWQESDDRIEAARVVAQERMDRFTLYSWLATFLIVIGGGLGILVWWFVRGRDVAVAMPAEFLTAPPDYPAGSGKVLTPALAGTLIDEEANVRDVLATLIDWAQRGVIRIRVLPQGAKTADPNDDYVFEKQNGAPSLEHQYERELMQRLFKGETSRSMLSIRQGFTASLDSMFDSLYNELRLNGYWEVSPKTVRGAYRRTAWLMLVLVCPAAFLFQIMASMFIEGDLFFSLPALAPWLALGVMLALMIYLARFFPRKTRQGAEATARWNAFRRYLEHIEKYTGVASAQDQFEKYLPYAVAFGIDKTWVEKFAAVDTPAPTWYVTSAAKPASSPSRPRPTTTTNTTTVTGPGTTSARPASPSQPAPTLDTASRGAFTSLNSMSASFFSMLNTTASTFVQSSSSYRPSSRSSRSGSSGSSSWHSSSSSSHSSFSGGGSHSGGGGGGGRSGFG